MKKFAVSLALVLAVGSGLTAVPAQAAHDHYGESAKKVAGEIGCKRFDRTGSGRWHKDAGICWVKGKRVNVITFATKAKQAKWNGAGEYALPSDFYWANGKGAVVVAKNGNRQAARIGADRLPGTVRHGL